MEEKELKKIVKKLLKECIRENNKEIKDKQKEKQDKQEEKRLQQDYKSFKMQEVCSEFFDYFYEEKDDDDNYKMLLKCNSEMAEKYKKNKDNFIKLKQDYIKNILT